MPTSDGFRPGDGPLDVFTFHFISFQLISLTSLTLNLNFTYFCYLNLLIFLTLKSFESTFGCVSWSYSRQLRESFGPGRGATLRVLAL